MFGNNTDNQMNRLAGRLSNIVLLGFFALLCCLPVVTAGASFTALYKAMGEYLRNDDDKVLKTFFRAFREYFGLSTKVFLLHLVFIAVFAWDLLYYRTGNSTIDYIGQAASFSLLMLTAFELTVVFTVIAEDLGTTVLKTVHTALNMAFICLKQSLSMLGLSIAAAVIVVMILRPFILVLPGVIAYLHWQIIPSMLEKYRKSEKRLNYIRESRKK